MSESDLDLLKRFAWDYADEEREGKALVVDLERGRGESDFVPMVLHAVGRHFAPVHAEAPEARIARVEAERDHYAKCWGLSKEMIALLRAELDTLRARRDTLALAVNTLKAELAGWDESCGPFANLGAPTMVLDEKGRGSIRMPDPPDNFCGKCNMGEPCDKHPQQ